MKSFNWWKLAYEVLKATCIALAGYAGLSTMI